MRWSIGVGIEVCDAWRDAGEFGAMLICFRMVLNYLVLSSAFADSVAHGWYEVKGPSAAQTRLWAPVFLKPRPRPSRQLHPASVVWAPLN